MIWLGVVDKRQAVCPSGPTLCGQRHFFAPLTVWERGTGHGYILWSDPDRYLNRRCYWRSPPTDRSREEP